MTWDHVTDEDLTDLEQRVTKSIYAEFSAAVAARSGPETLEAITRRGLVTQEAVTEIRRIINDKRKRTDERRTIEGATK